MAIDGRYVVNLKGKDFVLYAGLLDAAHQAGLKSIEVTVLQFPAPENGQLAVVQATANFEGERFFTEVGDCGPSNSTPMIAPHAVRMAATRAKGRALRDALNIGVTMFEELGADGPSTNGDGDRIAPRARHDPEDQAANPVCSEAGCGALLTKNEVVLSRQHFGQPLCKTHVQERRQRLADSAKPAQIQGA